MSFATNDTAFKVLEVLHSCRCCLLRPPDKDLKTPYIHLGKSEIYSDIIKECFNIHLSLENIECGICEVCVGRLRDAADFKLQVQRSQAELRARLKRKSHAKDGEQTVKLEVVEEDGAVHVTLYGELEVKLEMAHNEEVPGNFITKSGGGPGEVNSEMSDEGMIDTNLISPSEHLRDDTAQHACQTCRDTFHHEASLAAHMRDVHGYSCEARGEGATYTCDTCGKQFTRKTTLKRHIFQKQSYENSSEFPQKVNLNKHNVSQPGAKKALTCEVCNKRFIQRSHLAIHQRIHTGEKPYTCDICKKQFNKKAHVLSHMVTHTGQKPYSCTVCSRKFSHLSPLRRHKIVHTGEKPFRCEVCNKQFTRLNYFNIHKQIHTGDKSYVCRICNKQFTGKERKEHMETHVGKKSFSCDVCSKAFKRNSHLTQHLRMHTGEKPFSCEECNKKFAYNHSLVKHKRTHSNKPYACDVCKRRFTRKDYLVEHARTHTERKPYSCKVCNKFYYHLSALRRHEIIHTGEKYQASDPDMNEMIVGK